VKVIRCEEHNGCSISSEYRENQTEWDFALLKESSTNLGNQKEQSRERKRTRKMDTGSRKREENRMENSAQQRSYIAR
jgi:hypothetical protein